MQNNIENDLEITAEFPKQTSEGKFIKKVKAFIHKVTHSKYSYLFYCFLVPLCLMRIVYMTVGVLPGLDGSVLVLDLNGQYVYFYEALRDFLHGDANLLYSFSRALGGEFLGIYAYYVASPFAWLVALFPKTRMLEALLFVFLLKTGFCGLSFGYYLHKNTRRPNKFYIIALSTMYALCSYAVVQHHNSMWIDALIWLPIITYSVEILIREGKYKLFVASLAIMLASHYYIGYMVCIYVALYFFYYYIAHKGQNSTNEENHFIKSFFKISLSAVFAICMAAFIIIGAYYSLRFGKNTFSSPDWSMEIRYDIADLLAKAFPGTYDTVRPEGLPIIYCGTLSLILLPFYYLSSKITLREKICSTVLLSIFVISFTLNPVDIFWHGFQVPNWLNYRYSFIFSFLILIMTYKALEHITAQSSKVVFACGVFVVFAVMILEKFEFPNFKLNESDYYVEGKLDTYRTVWFTVLAVVALCAVLHYLIKSKKLKDRKKASKALMIVVCVEMLLNGVVNITALHFDVSFSSYSSYNDYFDNITPIVSAIQENDSSFYRMEKTHHRKTNDNMTLGTKGLSGSTSTLNKETVKFLNNMGYSSKSHWSKYLGGTPVNDSLLGVKYIVAQKNQPKSYSTYNENQAINDLMKDLYTVAAEDSYYVAYQNPYALSIAYQVDSIVRSFTYKAVDSSGAEKAVYASPFERLNRTLSAMLGREIAPFSPIKLDTSTHSNVRKSTIAGHTKYAITTSGTEAYVVLEFTATQNAHYFFHAPSEYPRETKFYVNGTKFGDFMANESNRIKSIGYFTSGEKINIKLELAADNLYLKEKEFYVYALDTEVLDSSFNQLAANQFNATKHSDAKLEGNITTVGSNATIQTTIPYDEGWKVYVDGQKVKIYKTFDALIAFDINGEGNHTLKFVYSPTPIILGAALSGVSIAAFATICIIDSKRKRVRSEINNINQETT